VHDFIVVYNDTFKYIDQIYGEEAVKDLWAAISERWCTHLSELIKTKGISGMLEYWGGGNGTLERENAGYKAELKNSVLKVEIANCPSVRELKERKREIYNSKLTYCDHCNALYPPIAKKYGYEMHIYIDYNEYGECEGRCMLVVR